MEKRRSQDVADTEKLRISLRVVFYRESDFWVAHCLEMDVMGHDRHKSKALRKLSDAIASQIENSVAANNYSNIFMPADARFFEMFAAGKDIAQGECVVEVKAIPGEDVTIQDINYREYRGLVLA